MSRRPWSSRFALWAAICALVLKSAVPMFAAGAAQMRGVPVAEVCPVYGVALPSAGVNEHDGHAHHHAGNAGHEDHSSHLAAAHSGDHCALTALASLAMPDVALPPVTAAHAIVAAVRPKTCAAFRDGCAIWVARLKHGPPALS